MIDYTHILKDAGLVAADAAGQVDSADKIANLGTGIVEGHLVVDVTAIEIASNDEAYKISLQGSSKSDFADTIVDLAILELGAKEVIGGDQDSEIGRYKVPFITEKNGTVWPYVRVYCDVSGTIATGINYNAHLAKSVLGRKRNAVAATTTTTTSTTTTSTTSTTSTTTTT